MSKLDFEILCNLGKLTKQIRKEVFQIVKEGIDIKEIINFVENKVFTEGYMPAFPCTVCINDVAAHYTVFDDSYILKKGDLVKVDFGICHNGFITDNAFTVEITTNNYSKLIEANLNGLNKIMDKIDLGITMSELGEIVENVAKDNGFNTIHNLRGHQISKYDLHSGISVPNFKSNDTAIVTENMELAIEPFFTLGAPMVKNKGNSNILHLMNDKPIRDPIAKKILEHIKENYPKLPFSKRWLVDDIIKSLNPISNGAFEKRKVLYALKLLKLNNNIYEYDALATVDGAMVSQFEDSVVFIDNRKTIITRL